jgi:hypothetical protein
MEIMSQIIANGQPLLSKLKIKEDIKMRSNEWKKYIQVNCRTCAHSTAEPSTPDSDAHWTCARFDRSVIPIATQYTGCDSHVLHPDLVPWQRLDGPDAWTAIYVIDGREVANGEGDANVYASRELLNAP